ncbi:hypothetical protein TWF696_008917 [Orbilia brochopaga]|uniref:Aminotransferase class I/classII large domain-containing protein n=1 Tax=Orbilia brochopaga TaxID=3140254 RepID=A0AAV9UED3_9PEZI
MESIAENSFMQKVVYDYLNKNLRLEAKQLGYGDGPNGSARLRKNLANFVNTYFHPVEDVRPEQIVASSGVSGIMDQLVWILCDEGDGILVGKPMYSGFAKDFEARSRVVPVPVSFGDIDPFSAQALACYEQELMNFNKERPGRRIRAVLLASPHNPFGKCYARQTLLAYMRFCEAHDLHLIVDEIYAMSIFKTMFNEGATEFHSVLSIPNSGIIDPKRIHVLYGMSKDFSSNGFRIGVVISHDKRVIEAMGGLTPFSWPSSPADLAWCIMLEDTAFLEYYLKEHQRRLGEGYEFLAGILDSLGIDYVRGGNAGFFLWIDLSFALERPVHGGEPGIDEDMELDQKLIRGGVHLAAGIGYEAEKVGWYRITFTQPRKLLLMGLEKLIRIVKQTDIKLSAEIPAECQDSLWGVEERPSL